MVTVTNLCYLRQKEINIQTETLVHYCKGKLIEEHTDCDKRMLFKEKSDWPRMLQTETLIRFFLKNVKYQVAILLLCTS